MNITCIEIENPYRYRAYCVGKKAHVRYSELFFIKSVR